MHLVTDVESVEALRLALGRDRASNRLRGKSILSRIVQTWSLLMIIDWNHFTPMTSFSGGILLGLAAAFFILVNGRVLGISGILGGVLRPRPADAGWRLAFLLGVLAAPLVCRLLATVPEARIDAGWITLVVAGVLVGAGTRYGSGCTTGHGVCGLSRLSPRSLVATLTFMGAGVVTVYLARHALA